MSVPPCDTATHSGLDKIRGGGTDHGTNMKQFETRTLLGAKGIIGARTLLGAPGITTRNKKLLGARSY